MSFVSCVCLLCARVRVFVVHPQTFTLAFFHHLLFLPFLLLLHLVFLFAFLSILHLHLFLLFIFLFVFFFFFFFHSFSFYLFLSLFSASGLDSIVFLSSFRHFSYSLICLYKTSQSYHFLPSIVSGQLHYFSLTARK